MIGPQILVRSLSKAAITGRYGNTWQYHSRSDHHSKLACWGVLLDLLSNCALLRKHAEAGEITFGLNHPMLDFRNNRSKKLDLVVCTPGSDSERGLEFADLIENYGIEMSPAEWKTLEALPMLRESPVGSVRIAVEAKACMTAHVKALPRLYDELNSSRLAIHGATNDAVAVGFGMVNGSSTFISPDMNKWDLSKYPTRTSQHKQPRDTERVLGKLAELPRRTGIDAEGFDALGAVVVDCPNDGTPVSLLTSSPAPQPGALLHYDEMIQRAAAHYQSRFRIK